jgi:preprotein translocase subunit SecE
MNDAAPEQGVGGNVDAVKLVVAILLIASGIAGFYALPTQAADWMRWGAVVVGVALAVAVFGSSARGKATWQFVIDSRQELRKVVWPDRQTTTQTTIIVFVFVIVVGLFFWFLDLFLSWATRFFTGTGS